MFSCDDANNSLPRTLSEEAILILHDKIIAVDGGLPGLCMDKSLSGAVNRVEHYIAYEGVEDIHEIAALYGIVIAQGHVFNDGNKRTAMVSMATFLDINGISLNAPEELIPDLLVDIATHKINREKLASWLKSYSVSSVQTF